MLTEETKTHRRCTQTQCAHFRVGGCKACETCKADPFVIKKSCTRCLNCEGVEGELRWTDPKAKAAAKAVMQMNEETEKRVVEMIKNPNKMVVIRHGGFNENEEEF